MLKQLPDASIDSIVTDPPYELGFMGKSWDSTGVAYDVTVWQECLRVLKPGGHLLAFGGSRTYHRLTCAIEDAGFQIRDQIMWVYGSGFPKSLNISKAIDKAAGAEREVTGLRKVSPSDLGQNSGWNALDTSSGEYKYTRSATDEAKQWDGWGTALKPAHEPIVMARKPITGTIANNVLEHGTGGLNIDGTRVDFVSDEDKKESTTKNQHQDFGTKPMTDNTVYGDYSMIQPTNYNPPGRFPANFIHDGSDEVLQLFPETKGGTWNTTKGARHFNNDGQPTEYATSKQDSTTGSAARFFYCAKANKQDRNEGLDPDLFPLQNYTDANKMGGAGDTMLTGSGNPRDGRKHNNHPTVKPTTLMRYLVRMVTPPNGTILDPFTGSGSTGKASIMEGFNFIGIEQNAQYVAIAQARIEWAVQQEEKPT